MSALTHVTHVVIHTAATPDKPVDISAKSIDAYHRGKGWDGIGYHWVVRFNGTIEPGRPENRMGAQVEGFNHCSIGICFSGNGDLQDLTPAQKKAGAKLVAEILKRHHLADEFKANQMRVIGHREINRLIDAEVTDAPRTTKTCPAAVTSK